MPSVFVSLIKSLSYPSTIYPVHYAGKVLDVKVEESCIIIGTLYADMPLKPNILREVSREVGYNQENTFR